MSIEIKLGDVVRLRKVHPCGSYEWEVMSVGANIGLRCLKCQRKGRPVIVGRDPERRGVVASPSYEAGLSKSRRFMSDVLCILRG